MRTVRWEHLRVAARGGAECNHSKSSALQLQVKVVWEEMSKRFDRIEVTDEPKRVYSNFIKDMRRYRRGFQRSVL